MGHLLVKKKHQKDVSFGNYSITFVSVILLISLLKGKDSFEQINWW